jgi:predicted Fe-Mo cluster-binding NifX family protein
MRVAIPHYQDEVAPCFEATAAITIFTVRRRKVVKQTRFSLQSKEALDRVRLLRDQEVNTLICGGLQASFEDLLRASGIQVVSWVTGNVDELLNRFLEGRLIPGTGRLAGPVDSRLPQVRPKKGLTRLT